MGKRKRIKAARTVPAYLGNRVCGVWPYVLSLIVNAAMHAGLFALSAHSVQNALRLVVSFIFFIYPFYYVTDVIWSMRPDVAAILAGEVKINRRQYANIIRTDVPTGRFLPVTVSIPVYTEDNTVIFETIRQSLAAVRRYRGLTGRQANVVVSDDGLAQMLGGHCTPAAAQDILARLAAAPHTLTAGEKAAAQRIWYYRENGVGFVARPAAKRPGRFKKASNLNYTIRLGNELARGYALTGLLGPGGAFAGGYAEGDIYTHEIILLLDKDSGVHEAIIEAVMPEFVADGGLAYVQCATNAANLAENFFTRAVGYNTNNLFHNIWPCKALQGYFVPLVGHNAFLRKSLLEESGLWAENRVSEDYDKAIRFYNIGYHGKYVQFAGLEFTEYVSRAFVEETGKQFRYSYGLLEMILQGTVQPGKTRGCDFLYMMLYLCSILNGALLLPTALLECYFGNVHLLWAGFFFCNVCFILLPCIRSLGMRRRLPKTQLGNLAHTSILAFSFLGHTYSMFAGVCKYFTDKIIPGARPFPATSVDAIDYRFADGARMLGEYIRKNKSFLVIALLCIERSMYLLADIYIALPTLLVYSYIFFGTVLIPVLLMPQFYARPAPRIKKAAPELRR